MAKKEKFVKKDIALDKGHDEYVLQIKKKCRWCWLLLLLLLPLILLTPLKKDVTFKVVNCINNTPVNNLQVNFDYTRRDFFDFENKGFFTRIYPAPKTNYYSDVTDSAGIVTFKDVKYTLYQWIFRNNDITRTYTPNNKCYGLDTTITLFHLKRFNEVCLSIYLKDVEFTVVDADDKNEPLNGAVVKIQADMLSYTDSTTSNASGKVYFKQVPLCSAIKVEGSKDGYYNDSIEGKLENHAGDTLFLKQEQVIVKFFVKDLYSKKPIAGAHGQLFFENDPNKQIGSHAVTNINGVGKSAVGEFNNVHIIKKIRIDVNKKQELIYYFDTSTVDYLGYVKVEQWNKKTDEEKTIYLRPKPNPIIFQNVDCKTKKGLAGIKNKVAIVKADGSTQGPVAIVSDKNGEFQISAGLGDKITIESTSDTLCPNEYLSNTTTVINALYEDLKDDVNKRKIPLCKKDAPKVKFRNIDEVSRKGIEGVKNTVTLNNGNSFTVISGKDGWFKINKVYECEIISIYADGASKGYGTNSNKIKDKPYNQLMPPNPQDIRDIPLKANPLSVKFCDVDQDGKVISGAKNDIYINGALSGTEPGGCFYVEAQPNDKIKIVGKYKGQTNATKVDGSLTLQQLENAGQNARNIPFKIENSLPCNEPIKDYTGSSELYFQLGSESYDFVLTYDFFSHPDEITIYCGRGTSGRILHRGMYSNSSGSPKTIHYNAKACNGFITVVIEPEGGDQSSSGNFQISCP